MRCPRWLITSGYWLIFIAWAGLIFWLSSRTAEQIPTFFGQVSDKVLHAVAFGLFTLFFLMAVHQGFVYPVRRSVLVTSVLVTLSYGVTDEWHQSMVATRVASTADLLADGAGCLAALAVYTRMSRFIRGRSGGGRGC